MSATGNGAKPLLEVEAMHTFYGSIEALKGVSLTVHEGEIVTMIGANGAGKSTTLRSISGIVPPRSGRIAFQGAEIQGLAGHEVAEIGISHAPEGRRIFPRMTVRENLEMGAFTRDDKAEIEADLDRVMGLFPRIKERLRQTAGMNPQESARLTAFMEQLRDERGITILLIEHDMRVVMGVSDRITVLDYGEKIAEGTPQEVRANPRVVEAYLGSQA